MPKITAMSDDEIFKLLVPSGHQQCKYADPDTNFSCNIFQNEIEMAEFLISIKQCNLRSFMEIGIANGGIGLLLSQLFDLQFIIGVDSFIEGSMGNFKDSLNRFKLIKIPWMIYTGTSSDFFKTHTTFFDLIFIDGCHDYEIVKEDFENSKRFLTQNGIIAFHDINDQTKRLWLEIKNERCDEFIKSNLGIGVWRP